MNELDQNLDCESVRILALARQVCAQAGMPRMCPEVYAVTILEYGPNGATRAIESLGGRAGELLAGCRDALQKKMAGIALAPGNFFDLQVDESCRPMVLAAKAYWAKAKTPRMGVLHILLGALQASRDVAAVFDGFRMGMPELRAAMLRQNATPKRPVTPPKPKSRVGTASGESIEAPSQPDDPLAAFCVDLNAQAAAGRLEPVIGREGEINRLVTILSRKKKNNPLLVGPAGTGKTAIVEGLAQRLNAGQVPTQLAGRRVFAVDMARLVAGTQFRGQFEERLTALLDAVRSNRGCILFIDEAHTIIGAGSALGTLDASNILKPALARGDLTCIGATTEAEYQKYIRKDKALDRRFQRIPVGEPSPADTLTMLKGLRASLESHHRCTIPDEALEAAVELSGRHITDRHYPDKAIDVIDEMCARYAGSGRPIDRDAAAQTVADQIGAPLSAVKPSDGQRAQLVHDELRRLVVGQDEAIEAVTHVVERAFSPLRDPARPLASLVFGGPSSVGKSYVAQILSRQLYANTPLVRINLAEFTEKHSVSRLIGSPPGYIGHGDRNQLTDRVQSHPNAVVIFDNCDKAHPEVLTLLMELLDTGVLTDAQGQEVNFRSTVVIYTTVAGSIGGAKAQVGFGAASVGSGTELARQRLVTACRSLFGDEFVNRVDAFVPFAPLGFDGLRQVAAFAIEQIRQRLAGTGITLRCADALLDDIARHSAHARAVRATIKSELEPLICAAFSRGAQRTIRLVLKDGQYAIA